MRKYPLILYLISGTSVHRCASRGEEFNLQHIELSPQNIILFALSAYAMGYIAAIPIGATQIEIAKRLLNGYTFSAIMIVAGAVSSDFIYGNFALFGIAPFLQSKTVTAYFSIANSLILIILGIFTLRQSKKSPAENKKANGFLLKKRTSFVTGFLLAVANPFIIYWWLLGSRFLGGVYGIEKYNTSNIFLYLAAGSLGIASYPLTMVFIIHKRKKFFSEKTIKKTTFVFGIALFVLAIYFMYDGVKGLI